MTAHRSPGAPYYYISHALTVPSDPWLRAFHTDLQSEIYRRLGPDPGYTGLLSQLHPGPWGADGWDCTPVMRCRTLLVLLTERYYREPRALGDLAVFRRRLLWEQHQTGERSTALVPVLWNTEGLPPRREPDTLNVPVGDYTAAGLSRLVGAPHARGGYLKVLRAVVERILTGARHSPPAMTPEDLYFTVSPGVSGMPRIPLTAGSFPDRQFAPVQVRLLPTHAAPPSHRAETRWAAAPRRSWFSTPGNHDRPILRGPHS
ncbi:hypothetical protein ABZ835_00760 [Streptomyces sp. NPDC047461]|uniref:hypothetical protein n=1 Tax=Streptomyces sp. NPDC047461 TaxID=3155619 RepID=UPI00340BB827